MRQLLLFALAVGIATAACRPALRQSRSRNTQPPAPPLEEMEDDFGTTVLLEKESLYHYIRVTQSGGIRHLRFRRSGGEYEESAIDMDDPLQFQMGYCSLMWAAFAHQPAPKTILFVGLGGGTLPMAIHHYFPEARIDNVELDPDVAAAAGDYFGFREDDRMKVYVRDGRVQVRRFLREKRKYDIIFLDAFRGGYIPYHLTTKEFAQSLRALLAPQGIVVSNLQSGFESYHYHRRTLAAVFPNQWSYGLQGNVIVVSHARPRSTWQGDALGDRSALAGGEGVHGQPAGGHRRGEIGRGLRAAGTDSDGRLRSHRRATRRASRVSRVLVHGDADEFSWRDALGLTDTATA